MILEEMLLLLTHMYNKSTSSTMRHITEEQNLQYMKNEMQKQTLINKISKIKSFNPLRVLENVF